jgi:hypothetical protein
MHNLRIEKNVKQSRRNIKSETNVVDWGLDIARKIAISHGGKIEVWRRGGGGYEGGGTRLFA